MEKITARRFVLGERGRIVKRDTMTSWVRWPRGRQPGQFYGVHSIAVDSKGKIYTTETYKDKRIQKFVFKGIGSVPAGEQGSLAEARRLTATRPQG